MSQRVQLGNIQKREDLAKTGNEQIMTGFSKTEVSDVPYILNIMLWFLYFFVRCSLKLVHCQ